MASNKNIQYLNKDFTSFKQALTDYAKTYFPSSYNDFSPSSPGTMFMEMASYIGDVLAFYQDTQFQEVFTQYAQEKNNLYSLAYMLGYKPKVTSVSVADLDVYQVLPSIPSGSVVVPDYRYSLVLEPGTQVKSTVNNINFYISDRIDFSISSSLNPTDLTVLSLDGSNLPSYYLLKKQVKAISGTEITTAFTFGVSQRFPHVTINDDSIISITSVIDSDGNTWYEVPYLAQETIYKEVSNDITNDPNFYQYNSTPYLLKLQKVPRRFVSRFKTVDELELQFGVGSAINVDEVIIPNPENVGLGIIDGLSKLNTAYDPSNFLFTNTYGIAPYNTTLTVKYLKGGGSISNVPSNTITDISTVVSSFKYNSLDPTLSSTVVNSLAITNPSSSIGGGDGDTEDNLRLNTLATFPAQQRAVTLNDYLIRAYSLPPQFGVISKAYVTQTPSDIKTSNPLAISMYILSQGIDGSLTTCSPVTKQNLKTYLSQFKLLTDAVEIRDAFIINIGINFDIVVLPNFNSQAVVLDCITVLQNYFDTSKWQVNQPVLLSELYVLLDGVKGVQYLKNIEVINKTGESLGYSKYAYDVKGATINRVVYPSLDPSIFELKFPLQDVLGRSVQF